MPTPSTPPPPVPPGSRPPGSPPPSTRLPGGASARPASPLAACALLLAGVAAVGLAEGLAGLLDDGGEGAFAAAPSILAYAVASWLVPALPCFLLGWLVAVGVGAGSAVDGRGIDRQRPARVAAGVGAAAYVGLALVLDGRGPIVALLGALAAAALAAFLVPGLGGARPARRATWAWLLLLACAGAAGWGCARSVALDDALGVRRGRPLVVLVVADALRRDALSCYGAREATSRIDSLADGGWRVDDTLSSSSWTLPAVSTLLSGASPRRHGVTDHDSVLPRGLPILPEALADEDFITGAVLGNPILRADRGFTRGFDALRGHPHEVEAGFFWIVRLDRWLRATGWTSGPNAGKKLVLPRLDGWSAVARRTGYLGADEVTDAALAFVDELDGRDGMLYVHYFDPHDPYLPHPTPITWDEPAFEVDARAELAALYRGEVAFLDAQFGRLLDGLAARGRFDDALIVFTSDHGEEFHEHDGFRHTGSLFGELVDVPLLVSFPGGRAPGPAPREASLADVAPSILSWLGRPPLEGAEGRVLSAEGPSLARFTERIQSDVRLAAVREGDWYTIVRFPESMPPTRALIEDWDVLRTRATTLSFEADMEAEDAPASPWVAPPDHVRAQVLEDGGVRFAPDEDRDDRAPDGRVTRVVRGVPFVVPRAGMFVARVTLGRDAPDLGSRGTDARLRLFVEERADDGSSGAWRVLQASVRLADDEVRSLHTAPIVLAGPATYRLGVQVLGAIDGDAGAWHVGRPELLLDTPQSFVDAAVYHLPTDPGMGVELADDEVRPRPDERTGVPPTAAESVPVRREDALRRLFGYLRRSGFVETRALADDDKERLRAIGYIGDDK